MHIDVWMPTEARSHVEVIGICELPDVGTGI